MGEAPLSDLPRVLSRPFWLFGKPSRVVKPVTVKPAASNATNVAAQVEAIKDGNLEEVVASPAIAVALVDAMNIFGGWRAEIDAPAWVYFQTFTEATLEGILPIAVGETGPKRKIAERIVRELARMHSDLVRAVAKEYGKKALASVEEILTVDRRHDCPNAAPTMPDTWKPATFTRPRLKDGRELPLVAVDRIGHMLAFSTLDRPYAGLDDVEDACEPRSLAELVWDTARAWDASGAPRKDQWMLESLAHLGDDQVIRRTTPALASTYVIHVLGHVATDAAAIELCTIAWRAAQDPPKPTSARTVADVAAAFAVIARKRGITVDEVEDSLLPTIPVAAAGDADAPVSSRLVSMRSRSLDARVQLDYGSRTVAVGFDERLDPFVESSGGTKLRDLPRASPSDDAVKVAQAKEVWRELQEDVAAIADVRLASLERAMLTGRTWTLPMFRRAWTEHPLMRHVSRSVLWRSPSGAFRIAEDGTFADIRDTELRDVATISAAHPAELPTEERLRWTESFADYRIIQPIEQLARRLVPPEALGGKSVKLVTAAPTTQQEFYLRLSKRRFTLQRVEGQEIATRAGARSKGRLRLTLAFDKQTVGTLDLYLYNVHPVDASEVAYDLELVVP